MLAKTWPRPSDHADDWMQVDIVSDLHLCAELPQTFEAFSRYLNSTTANAVVLLGDIFEAWVGDDARHHGFEAEVAACLKEGAGRRPTAFMVGNRDFLVGPELAAHCGLQLLNDPCVLQWGEQRCLLTHGDALCLADKPYQAVRPMLRSEAWQQDFLAKPLAARQAFAKQSREASQASRQGEQGQALPYGDIDFEAAQNWLKTHGCRVMIHGHTHRPASEPLGQGFTRHVLSDWDLDGTPPRAEVLRLERDGQIRRLTLGAACTPITSA